ncbi:NinE family protein, partial [Salmonella enterica]|nr:NinE family protein [Salmonella enterica]
MTDIICENCKYLP